MNKYLLGTVIFSSLLISFSAHAVDFRNDVKKRITVNNGLSWGRWMPAYYCPPQTYVKGFNIKVEGNQGDGDDSALNDLMLICSNGNKLTSQGVNGWGGWGRDTKCSNSSYISAFVLKVEGSIGDGDDTAVNSFGAECSNGGTINPSNSAPWGVWGKMVHCPTGTVACGAQLRSEKALSDGDDTSVNNIALYCCSK